MSTADRLGKYGWLASEPGPRILIEALNLFNVAETQGPENNRVIIDWAAECNIKGYSADSTPWCGLFVAVAAKRAGKPLPENPLWARNWGAWGESSAKELGAILVFTRDRNSGHVGIYVGEDSECYHVLGGNQGDRVSIIRIPKRRLIGCRAMYKVGKPTNVRPVYLAPQGEISVNER